MLGGSQASESRRIPLELLHGRTAAVQVIVRSTHRKIAVEGSTAALGQTGQTGAFE